MADRRRRTAGEGGGNIDFSGSGNRADGAYINTGTHNNYGGDRGIHLSNRGGNQQFTGSNFNTGDNSTQSISRSGTGDTKVAGGNMTDYSRRSGGDFHDNSRGHGVGDINVSRGSDMEKALKWIGLAAIIWFLYQALQWLQRQN